MFPDLQKSVQPPNLLQQIHKKKGKPKGEQYKYDCRSGVLGKSKECGDYPPKSVPKKHGQQGDVVETLKFESVHTDLGRR